MCHDALDRRAGEDTDAAEVFECFIRGSAETRERLVEKGLIKVEGAK
jgi:hypothetical protein